MSGKQVMSIEQYLRKTGKFEQNIFTVAELQEIARATKTDLLEVMYYLRFER